VAMTLACDETLDWDPDDPRLPELAARMGGWSTKRPHSTGDDPMGDDDDVVLVVNLMAADIVAASPAWDRLPAGRGARPPRGQRPGREPNFDTYRRGLEHRAGSGHRPEAPRIVGVPTEQPLNCETRGSEGKRLPVPSTERLVGNLVIGLDPSCPDCQALAHEAGVVFPPRFGSPPLDDI
jgi:hypothetical protein